MFLKTTSEGRQRAKQKRFESELEREKKNQQDEEKRLYVPNLGISFNVIHCGQMLMRKGQSCVVKDKALSG